MVGLDAGRKLGLQGRGLWEEDEGDVYVVEESDGHYTGINC